MSDICSHCHVGALTLQTGTWARAIGSHLIVVPNIGTMVCDGCGRLEYDQDTLVHLGALLQLGGPLQTIETRPPATSFMPEHVAKDWAVSGA